MTEHPYAATLRAAQEVIEQLSPQREPHSGTESFQLDAAQLDALIQAADALRKIVREQYLRDYAETLLLEHANGIEGLSIHDMVDEHLVGGGELTDEEFRQVRAMIDQATVTVRMPLLPEGVDR